MRPTNNQATLGQVMLPVSSFLSMFPRLCGASVRFPSTQHSHHGCIGMCLNMRRSRSRSPGAFGAVTNSIAIGSLAIANSSRRTAISDSCSCLFTISSSACRSCHSCRGNFSDAPDPITLSMRGLPVCCEQRPGRSWVTDFSIVAFTGPSDPPHELSLG